MLQLAMERVPEEDREKPPWKRNVETYRSQFYRLLQEQDQIPVRAMFCHPGSRPIDR